jgi:TolB-like protein
MRKLMILPALLFMTAVLFAQAKPRLAILPFTGGTGGDGETIAMLFSYERELSNVFTIIPRTSSIEAIMREQQFQRSSGLTDSDTIARLGRQYNADYVVAGHIQTLGASKLVLITVIHVESLRQIAGDYKEYTDIEEVQAMIPGMAQQIAVASRTSGTSLPQLAVLPFATPAGVDQRDAEVLAQLLAVEIANSGKYAVLPRTATIQSVMAEHEIQRSGITDANNIKVIGQALNAQYVLAGSVRSLGRTNLFTAEIINIENASQLTGDYVNYRTMDDGLNLMAELGTKLTGVAGGNVVHAGTAVIENITYASVSGGEWTLQSDGRRKSPTTRDGSMTKMRVSFTSTVPNASIIIQLDVSSESGCDFAFISTLDNPAATYDAGYYTDSRISGSTTKTVTIPVPVPGNHSIYIGYGKDRSVSDGSDCAWFTVIQTEHPVPASMVRAESGGAAIGNIIYTSASGGEWILQSDGRRKSPTTRDGSMTKMRVSFTSTVPNASIIIQLDVSSESNHDFAFISTLDNAAATYDAGYHTDGRISGSTTKTVTIPVPVPGNHSIYIGYGKDRSVSDGSDCAWFTVIQ